VLSLSCDFISFQKKGIFSFFGETFPDQAKKALQLLEKEIQFVEEDPIQQSELDRAKARIKSEWLYGSETPHGQASTLGSLSALGRLPLIDTYLNDIEHLTLSDLSRAWKKYLKDAQFKTTLIKPQ
jgi:predicted Zn-dependent peptidase